MKNLFVILAIALTSISYSQSPVNLIAINSYGKVRGGIEVDSALSLPMGDTILKFVNQRRPGRILYRPADRRLYVYDGTVWHPASRFTAAYETKLNGISPGATANQTDAQLRDRSTHTGFQPYTTITGLATVSNTGQYSDLLGIPDLAQYLLKSDTTGKWRPSNWVPTYAQVANKPTTLAGFGITDAVRMSDTIGGSGSGVIMTTSSANASLNSKVPKSTTITINGNTQNFNTNPSFSGVGVELPAQTGQAGKVLSSNGSSPQWVSASSGTVSSVNVSSSTLSVSGGPVTTSGSITVNLPNTGTASTYGIVTTDTQGRVTSGRRQETYSGTTNASGLYTVTFSTPYSIAPNVQVAIQGDFASYTAVVSSKSTTGFTVKVYTLSSILSLGLVPQYSPVPNVPVDIIVTEK